MIWENNLKYDIDQISKYVYSLNQYLEHIYIIGDKNRFAHYSIIKQFSDSLDSITILLNRNYNFDNKLRTGKINNISGIFILLRKCLEANMMLNIILNSRSDIYEAYLSQIEIDESHLSKMFSTTNYDFTNYTNISKEKYYWTNSLKSDSVKTINDLIDLANIMPDAKANIKTWVNECNYMSHPTLYSSYSIISQFNGEFIKDLQYIFEILIDMMGTFYEMIEVIELQPEFNSNYNLDLIYSCIPDFSLFRNNFNSVKRIFNKNIPIDNNKNDIVSSNIKDQLIFLNLELTSFFTKGSFEERKKSALAKLLDVFTQDLYDLLKGYFSKKDLLFYPKIRQVLEDISYIDKILKMEEDQIELFQCYTDIQRYSNMANAANILNGFNDQIPDYKNIKMNNMDLTAEEYYYENIDFFKKYILKNFNKKFKTTRIKIPNSWMYDGKKIPSNWQIIKEMIQSNIFIESIDIDFYNGMYSLSSLFCHVNHFSVINETVKTDESYIKYMKGIMILVKGLYDKLFLQTSLEFRELIKDNINQIDKLLFNLYNYDIINVPNPS